jgi:CDP-paratose 2-epimerase
MCQLEAVKSRKVIITGSLGLIGFEATQFFLDKGDTVIGIDNDLRGKIFKIKTQYGRKLKKLKEKFPKTYLHYDCDITEKQKINEIFKKNGKELFSVIHTAAQTSHDWAQKDPPLDFSINAFATLELLEAFKKYAADATFIFTSTNKVYGDSVNYLPLKEYKKRYDIPVQNKYYQGIPESYSIDQSMHSLFGVSKISADLLVQEYGRYFNLKTGVFRLGVVSGGGQSASLYQGFLSYLIEQHFKSDGILVVGYKGKQVRDIIHARDVIAAFYEYARKPKSGEVFNMGGGRGNSVSILEILDKLETLAGKKAKINYIDVARKGDHIWWISDTDKFKKSYPSWRINYTIDDIISDIYKSYDLSGKV